MQPCDSQKSVDRSVIAAGVLAVNVGSSSVKCAYYTNGQRQWRAAARCIDLSSSSLEFQMEGASIQVMERGSGDILAQLCELLKSATVTHQKCQPSIIIHRVKFGGHDHATREIDDDLVATIRAQYFLSSMHATFTLRMIDLCQIIFTKSVHVAAFDSHFFAGMTDVAAAGSFRPNTKRRYELLPTGHHGLACRAIVTQVDMRPDNPGTRLICHLGSGVSITAIRGGRPVANTMTIAASDGPVMNKRSGNIGPGQILSLLHFGLPADSLWEVLNEGSGLFGAAGIEAAGDLNAADILKLHAGTYVSELYVRQVVLALVDYSIRFGDVTDLIFAGGVAGHSPQIVDRILAMYEMTRGNTVGGDQPGLKRDSAARKILSGLLVHYVSIDEQDVLRDMATEWLQNPTLPRRILFREAVCVTPGVVRANLIRGPMGTSKSSGPDDANQAVFVVPALTPEAAYRHRLAAGLITFDGERTSHGAAICREVSLPCLCGVAEADLAPWTWERPVYIDFAAQEVMSC